MAESIDINIDKEQAKSLLRNTDDRKGENTENSSGSTDVASHHEEMDLRTQFALQVGNALEWFDFAVFGYLAADISEKFFPEEMSENARLSATFGIYWAAFLARPIGGILYGYFGDTDSRALALKWSIVFIAITTLLIGCLPTYDDIGVFSPILLIIIRIGQGMSVGGEYIGSMTIACELAPENQRAWYSSLCNVGGDLGALGGILVCFACATILGDEAMESYGWRLPFLSSIFLSLVGIWLRQALHDPEMFEHSRDAQEQRHDERSPLTQAFQEYPWLIFGLVLIMAGPAAFYYGVFVWVITYQTEILPDSERMHENVSYLSNIIAILVLICAELFFAKVSDHHVEHGVHDRNYLLLWALCMSTAVAPLGFYVFGFGDFYSSTFLSSVPLAVFTGMYTPLYAWLIEQFPARIRYTACSFCHNVAYLTFGGTAALIGTEIENWTGSVTLVGVYLSIITGISAIVVWQHGKTRSLEEWEQLEDDQPSSSGFKDTDTNQSLAQENTISKIKAALSDDDNDGGNWPRRRANP